MFNFEKDMSSVFKKISGDITIPDGDNKYTNKDRQNFFEKQINVVLTFLGLIFAGSSFIISPLNASYWFNLMWVIFNYTLLLIAALCFVLGIFYMGSMGVNHYFISKGLFIIILLLGIVGNLAFLIIAINAFSVK